jgi:catechol 2,3-dioxygenase-like lactoylglutathione lyase family enzyme
MASSVGPRVFRILLPASDLDAARKFYETLLGVPGRHVAGGRVYFDCGAVIVGILDYSTQEERPTVAEAIYLATGDLEGVHGRARALGCLDPGFLHDDRGSPLGEIVVRPWGERSFYVRDLSGNPLCFVEEGTQFTGTPEQIRALERAR